MIATLLPAIAQLTEIQRAIRDQFRQGGSLATVLVIVLILVIVVLSTYYLTLRQRATVVDPRRADPEELFNDLLRKLSLTTTQRDLLTAVATGLALKDPAVVLLCPALFDRYVKQWYTEQPGGVGEEGRHTPSDVIAQTRSVLFPTA